MNNIPKKIYLHPLLSDKWYEEKEPRCDNEEYIHIDTVQELINFFSKKRIDKKFILEHLKLLEDAP